MIEIKDLTKKYGDLVAVNRLNLRVKKGELFGFLGPNGAGKTTTIKMLIGLLKMTEGDVRIGGINIGEKPLKVKAISGYLPEYPVLYPKLTGREYIEFIADLYGTGKGEQEKKIKELLHLFDLEEKADQLIETYSRGMRQKTAIVSILVHKPEVLFLDEPIVGLDPKSARVLKDVLHKLCVSGATVFLNTHILEVAEMICDRVGIVNHGKLLAVGTKTELQKLVKGDNLTLEKIFLELTGSAGHGEIIHLLKDRTDQLS